MTDFEKKLEDLLKLAKDNKNTISALEIENVCPDDDDDDSLYNRLLSALKENDITVNEDYSEDDEISDAEIDLKEIEEEKIDLSQENFAQIENEFKSNDSVKFYLLEIGKVPLLSLEEERKLTLEIYEAKEAEKVLETLDETSVDSATYKDLQDKLKRGEVASEKLINSNLRLVVHCAKRYTNLRMDFLDLIQEGNMGLIKSLDKFDPYKGYKFSTYATWWIRQAITRAISDQSRTIRIPVHVNEHLTKIKRAEKELIQILGREPSDEEVADKIGISVHKLQRLKSLNDNVVSLSNPVGEEQDSSLEDFIPDEKNMNPYEYTKRIKMRQEIDEILNQILNYREKTILELRFGLNDGKPKTLEEVGKVFNVTRERIRQIEAKALRKIRYSKVGKHLRDYITN